MGRLMPDNAFPESCCDGGECALNDNSCQPCGCDKGANWMCDRHAAESAAREELRVRGEENTNMVTVTSPAGPAATITLPFPTKLPPALAELSKALGVELGVKASILPTDSDARKDYPIVTGVLDYFPDALLEVARVSKAGNDQHNPGQPLHWARGKSTDQANTLGRHLLQRGTRDSDGQRHTAKVAWRALAMLQTEIEDEREKEKAA